MPYRVPLKSLARRIEPRILSALIGLAGLVFLFVSVAEDVLEKESHAFDRVILLSLRSADDLSLPIGPHWLEPVFRDITSLGGVTVITLMTVLTTIYLIAAGKYRSGVLVAIAIALGSIVSSLLKYVFERARPDVVPHLVEVQTLSFPSGHAMMSAVAYLTLGALVARAQSSWRLRIFVFSVGVILTLLIGISRVYLGVHWPTDVLAGWVAGAAWALTFWLVAEALFGRRSPSNGEPEA